jgi:FkbM family methyltransferase
VEIMSHTVHPVAPASQTRTLQADGVDRAAGSARAGVTALRPAGVGQSSVVAAPRRDRPRVLFLADRPGWAFDIDAHGVAAALHDEFECRVAYVAERPDLRAWEHDVLVVMFWGEDYHRRFAPDPRRTIKQISSHRWALEAPYGLLTPAQLAERHLKDASTLIVPSARLHDALAPYRKTYRTPKGFDPGQFAARTPSHGPLRVGWVGNRNDACKGLTDILLPAAGRDFELIVAGGDVGLDRMAEFYRQLDVLCVASTAEGDPRPLIEAMASGCFPVAVDVGIVPELVDHRENGLIVERSVAAFRAALQWCRWNADFVRERGQANAERLRTTRTWAQVAPSWADAFRAALGTEPAVTRESVTARAFRAGYALAEREAPQAALDATFRIATGSPDAPAGYQDAVTLALAALRPDHKVIVDVGAWLGNFAMNAAVLNPEAEVFAIEPEPANFSFLARRAPVNVVPLRVAVARECGQTHLFLSRNSQGHTVYRELLGPTHRSTTPVRMIRFDQLVDLAGGSVDFMKINAEGAEYDILRSPAFAKVREAVVEVHLEGTDDQSARLLADVARTHDVTVLADLTPRFLYVRLTRKPAAPPEHAS